MKKIILLFCLLILASSLLAQYYGKNKIQPQKNDWKYMQTMHFDIYYPAGDDDFGRIVALAAEEAYYYIREDFRFPLKRRVPVIFYSTHQEFEVTNVIPNLLSEGVGGFTESMYNRVVLPFSGSYRQMEEILIHELTHAYVNDLSHNGRGFAGKRSLPFWLSEGLPEFLSVNGKSKYNNMFIFDLVINNGLINLSDVGGYYAYREGESFLNYLEEEYGRNTVMDFFYSIRSDVADEVVKRLFNMTFLELQQRWENHLKRGYFSIYDNYSVPYEAYERITNGQKEGSSLNVAPRFAPDGVHYCWFSNKNITDGIWLSDRLNLSHKKELIRSATNGNLEEFHFKRNNISWFPDSTKIAFAANTSFGDCIHILDTTTAKITETIAFDSVKVIYEVDVSPDGNKIAFSGIKNAAADIYVYDIERDSLQCLFSDRYYEGQPRWSPDGSRLAFYSERVPFIPSRNYHLFDHSVRNIYFYDFNLKEFFQVTDENFDCYHPVWSSEGDKILFISEQDTIINIQAVDILTADIAQVTNTICGVLNFDLSSKDENLILSVFYNACWDLFLHDSPLDSLNWQGYHFPRKIELSDDFWSVYDIQRIRYFGKTNLAFKKPGPRQNIDPELARMYDVKIDYGPDTTIVEHNRKIDRRPVVENEPVIKPYKLKWKLDNLWGGLAYNSNGTYAMLNLWASDILGNHSLYSSFSVTGEIENSSFRLQYLDLTHRNDYGGGLFYLNDETIWRTDFYNSDTFDYFRERDRQYGVFAAYNHPVDKYWRIDSQLALLRHQTFRDWWDWNNDDWIDTWLPQDFAENFDLKEEEDDFIVAPAVSLVHDNTIYGSTGPVSGGKQYLTLQHSLSTSDSYSLIYSDLRLYRFFAKRYSWANRCIAAWTDNDKLSGFELTGFNGVRGFNDDSIDGKRKILLSTELRYPLIDNLSFAFPVPLRFYGIRGSAFIDLGAVWDREKDLKIWDNGRLKSAYMGIGFGPRFNMGFFILKFDVAWQTDMMNASRPRYYLWLIEDF